MKTSLVITILNEEGSIADFIESVCAQTVLPSELIIVDGGSTDKTLSVIKTVIKAHKKDLPVHDFTKKGNRSVGRNFGIAKAKNEIILLSDAGCVLDKHWVEEIEKPFNKKNVDVVAGYYAARAQTVFQRCLVPYVLVMPERVNPDSFLPATRSMAIRKSVWQEVGGFNENYSHNEDYVLALNLRKASKKIVFAQKAIVYWIPRETFHEAFIMFYRFALGDAEAGILRPKVVVIFVRYTLTLILLLVGLLTASLSTLLIFLALLVLYLLWSASKNYRYVGSWQACYYLPLIQLISDVAVIRGTLKGLQKKYGV